jgi:hypothetical protein
MSMMSYLIYIGSCAEAKLKRYMSNFFESMIVSKDPTIASGATPIGSAGRAPDKKEEDKRSQIVLCRSR